MRRARGTNRAAAALGLALLAAGGLLLLAPATMGAKPRLPRAVVTPPAPKPPEDGGHEAPRAGKSASAGSGRVLIVRIEGVISPVADEALGNAIERAEDQGYRALILEIDTPGGLETSMRAMVKKILASEVPIISWVTPSGGRAASAGVFVTIACDVAAMAPGTNIGAATPVNLQGGMDSTLARKATNDASAFARTVAAQRGRNAVWAERAVREAVSASETEAVSLKVVDFIAATLPELLAKADGRAWRRGERTEILRVKDLPSDRIEPGFRQRVLGVLADPNVAYILMLLGFYGLLFELQNPGAILPGIVGAICLILAFLALSALPVNYAGVALIILAVLFFLAEIKVASHGLLAAGGVVALILGSLILFQGGKGASLSWGIILGATASTAIFFLWIVGAGLRAQRRPVTTGGRGLVGTRAVVTERLAPSGRVRIGDELWNAAADAPIDVGTEVVVTDVNKLTLRVRPAAEGGRS